MADYLDKFGLLRLPAIAAERAYANNRRPAVGRILSELIGYLAHPCCAGVLEHEALDLEDDNIYSFEVLRLKDNDGNLSIFSKKDEIKAAKRCDLIVPVYRMAFIKDGFIELEDCVVKNDDLRVVSAWAFGKGLTLADRVELADMTPEEKATHLTHIGKPCYTDGKKIN